jgi:hypothetical protein
MKCACAILPGPIFDCGVDKEVGRLCWAGVDGNIGIGAHKVKARRSQASDHCGCGVEERRVFTLGDLRTFGQLALTGQVHHVCPMVGLVGRLTEWIADTKGSRQEQVEQDETERNKSIT